MRTVLFTLFILMSISAIGAAYDMPLSPIHTQLTYDMQLVASDEFDAVNKTKEDQPSITGTAEAPKGRKKVSVIKSALYSALLPGLGEYKLGHKGKAKIFFTAEALTWVGFIAFKVYCNWKEDDMISFAADRANAQLDDKDDTFIDLVGFYESIDQYNSLGRVSDRDRPFYPDVPEYHWYWQSEADQETFRDIKNASRDADRKAQFMIGLAVFNRLVSVIDTIRDARRAKNSIEDDEFTKDKRFDYKFSINPLSNKNQLKLTIYTPF